MKLENGMISIIVFTGVCGISRYITPCNAQYFKSNVVSSFCSVCGCNIELDLTKDDIALESLDKYTVSNVTCNGMITDTIDDNTPDMISDIVV